MVREDPDRPEFVSRGGHKLAGALQALAPHGLTVAGRRCLDAGASTGGFTDVLLRRAPGRWSPSTWATASSPGRCSPTRGSPCTTAPTSASSTPELVGGPVDVVVGDLSFISLRLVLDALLAVTVEDGDLLLMVKPQFEVGKDRVGKGGVVRDLDTRVDAVASVAAAAAERGWGAQAVTTSPLPGPAGNVEYFLWLRRGTADVDRAQIDAEVRRTAHLGAPGEKVVP